MEPEFTQLSEDDCMTLLTRSKVGRVGFVADGVPVILPVNFVVDEDRTILMRVRNDSVLSEIPQTQVAFEVDEIHADSHTGWSVLVQGRARDVSSAVDERAEHLRTLTVSPWAAGERTQWLAILPTHISGRRIG